MNITLGCAICYLYTLCSHTYWQTLARTSDCHCNATKIYCNNYGQW